MSKSLPGLSVEELRAAFDQSFSHEPISTGGDRAELLAIRAHQCQVALRANETAAILRCPPLSSLPSRSSALCGLAGVRGSLVAVYSIAALLGESRGPATSAWIVLCAADRSVALLFDELVGYARVASREILSTELGHDLAVPAKELVRIGDTQRALLAIPDLLETIHRIAGSDL